MSRNRSNQAVSDNTDNAGNTDVLDVQPETTETDTPDTTDNTGDSDNTDAATETGKFDVSVLSVSNPDGVREAYASADKGGKARIRKFVTDAMMTAIVAKDMDAALAAKELNESLVTERANSATVVDYAQKVAERIVSLQNGIDRLLSDGPNNLPEGVELDLSAVQVKVDELLNSDNPDLVDESILSVKWGVKAQKRSIVSHVTEWANSVESGKFATIAQIAAFRSDEYGTDNPSNGAVAAHLFGNADTAHDGSKYEMSGTTGVVPVDRTATTVRGARKI